MVNDSRTLNVFNWIGFGAWRFLLMVDDGRSREFAGAPKDGRGTGKAVRQEKLWRVMLLLSAAATDSYDSLQCGFFGSTFPSYGFMQFPWRWMAILAVGPMPISWGAGGGWARPRRRAMAPGARAVIVVIAGTATFLVRSAWWDSEGHTRFLQRSDCETTRVF